MDPVVQNVVRFFEGDDVPYQLDEEDGRVSCSIAGRNGTLDIYVECKAGPSLFKVFVYAPVPVPEGRRCAVAEFCNRMNWAMGPGTLEMSPDDGRVRYRCSTWTDGSPLSTDALAYLIRGSYGTLQGLLPAVLAVSWGSIDPADAVRMAMEEDAA